MTTHIFGTSYVTNNLFAVDLDAYDRVYVSAGVTVASETSTAISSEFGYHRVDIFGNVIGNTYGVQLGGNSLMSHSSRLFLYEGGQIFGYGGAGVYLRGYSNAFTNSGYVYGDNGVKIGGDHGNSTSAVYNAGTIEGDQAGIYHDQLYSAAPSLQLTNTGTIRGGTYSYLSENSDLVKDLVFNKGTMVGDVMLGGGADYLDNSLGKVQGKINLGDDNDTIVGGAGVEIIFAGTGADVIQGGGGGDTIEGFSGRDTMTGGAGADKFVFKLISSSGNTSGTADTLTDFKKSGADRIDLSAIDANANLANNQAFKFVGTAAFKNAGDLRYSVSGGHAYVAADVTGDKVADFIIKLNNTPSLVAGDFVL